MQTRSPEPEAACLVIHGYGGSPFEVEGLARALETAGFATSVPTLPGHADGYEGFGDVHFPDWLAHVEKELADMQKQFARVMILGFSMGGVLALNLACRYQVAGVVSLAAPLYVCTLFPWPLVNLQFYVNSGISLIGRFMATAPSKEAEDGENSRDIAPWKGYRGPLHFRQLRSMREGCAATRTMLPRLTAPILVMNDVRDGLVYSGNAWEIVRRVSSQDASLVLTRIQETISHHHMIPTHRETVDMVTEAVVRFGREKVLDPRPVVWV